MLKKVLTVIVLFFMIAMIFNPLLGSADTTAKNSETIYVDDDNVDGPWDGSLNHPYRTIQEGINVSSDGSTVFVFNGVYTEHLKIQKEIALIGEDNSATILQDITQSAYQPSLMSISSDNVTVENLCLRKNANMNQHKVITAIGCDEQDGIHIQHNHFINCNKCMHFRESSAEISDNYMVRGTSRSSSSIYIGNPTLGSEIIISNNTIINYTHGIHLSCCVSWPSKILIDNNYIESTPVENPYVEDPMGIEFVYYPKSECINYYMRLSHNVIKGFEIGFGYKNVYLNLGSKLDDSSVDILSNSFDNKENDLFITPNSRWSKETLTITKNNFYGQNNSKLFLNVYLHDPFYWLYYGFTTKIQRSRTQWNNNYWHNHMETGPVKVSGILEIWVDVSTMEQNIDVPIYKKDRNPADTPFDI